MILQIDVISYFIKEKLKQKSYKKAQLIRRCEKRTKFFKHNKIFQDYSPQKITSRNRKDDNKYKGNALEKDMNPIILPTAMGK